MGISPPSLYAAFGDKEKLFLAALERRSAHCLLGASTAKAAVAGLRAETARELPSGDAAVKAATRREATW
jgi:TetR/AcrR family transcriptional regulator, copper-responsive repressor